MSLGTTLMDIVGILDATIASATEKILTGLGPAMKQTTRRMRRRLVRPNPIVDKQWSFERGDFDIITPILG